MTVVLILLAALIVAAVLAPIVSDPHGTRALRQALDDRAKELETYRESTMEMVGEFVTAIKELSGREIDDQRIMIGALTRDRERLVTAVLAGANPNAAALLARSDEASARAAARAPEDFGAFLRETIGERERMATEFTDEQGAPVMPVGMQ